MSHSLMLFWLMLYACCAFTYPLRAPRVHLISSLARFVHMAETEGSIDKMDESSEVWTSRITKSIAKSRKIKGGNYVQIATVDADGLPTCRTVVFRGFTNINSKKFGEIKTMRMITDKRSEKVSHILNKPAAELVWWFSQSSEQYRLSGELILINPTIKIDDDLDATQLLALRNQQWNDLSDPAREQFFWNQPGVSYSDIAHEIPKGGRDANNHILPPPDSFSLLLLYPTKCKYLRLRDNFAQQDVLIESNWSANRVNP